MPTDILTLSRLEQFRRHQDNARRVAILTERALHWTALAHGASALSRDYAQADEATSRFMVDLTFRAANMKRGIVGELSSLNIEQNSIRAALRVSDRLLTLPELKALQDQADKERGI